MFVQVLVFALLLRRALRASESTTAPDGYMRLEESLLKQREATATLAGSRLPQRYLAWVAVNFAYYYVLILLLLLSFQESHSDSIVLANRLLSQVCFFVLQGVTEAVLAETDAPCATMLFAVPRFFIGLANRVMIPGLSSLESQIYLVLWISGIDIVLRMARPLLSGLGRRLKRAIGAAGAVDPLSPAARAELATHQLLTSMMARNLSILAALVVVVAFRAVRGQDVLGRSLVLIFSLQLVASFAVDLLCLHFESRYLDLRLSPKVLALHLDWRALLRPLTITVFLEANILISVYPQLLDAH
jgi:hypothetical protein